MSISAYYLVIRGASWSPNNSTGTIGISSVTTNIGRDQVNTTNLFKSDQSVQQFVNIEKHNNVGDIIECYAYQNSGVNADVSPYIHAFIIKRI